MVLRSGGSSQDQDEESDWLSIRVLSDYQCVGQIGRYFAVVSGLRLHENKTSAEFTESGLIIPGV